MTPHLVRVRALRPVLAQVGSILLVNKQEAAALIAMGNAEAVDDDKKQPADEKKPDEQQPQPPADHRTGGYERSDMTAREPHGTARKTRH